MADQTQNVLNHAHQVHDGDFQTPKFEIPKTPEVKVINEQVVEKLRPNFSKAELRNAQLPKRIAKEIRLEKYRILFVNLASSVMLIVSIFFLLAYFVAVPVHNEARNVTTKWLIDTNYIPHPALMFVLLAIGLVLFIFSWIDYGHVITSVNRYKTDILMNIESVPYFLIKSYRSAVARVIYINWACIATYILTGITIGILFAISAINPAMKLYGEKNICYVILGSVAAFHIVALILIHYHKGSLNSYYGKDLISLEEQKQITKTANKRCVIVLFVFLAIILVFIVVPWMLIRKRKGLKPVPFI